MKIPNPAFAPEGIARGMTGLSKMAPLTFSPPDSDRGSAKSAEVVTADNDATVPGIATDPPQADLDLMDEIIGSAAA